MIDDLAKHTKAIIELLGYDLNDPHLADSPARIARYLAEWHTMGDEPPKLTTFPAENYDEMIIQEPIPFHALCAHHGLSFHGTVTVGYVPSKAIIGLSKFARVIDHFANRYTVQERLTVQVADALTELLDPRGCGVSIRGEHLCMASRGVKKPGVWTTTTVLRGLFKDDAAARSEFLMRIT